MKKVITYGTFDLFHQGHYNILKRAKEYGDYLIVGVTGENYDIARGKLSVKDSLAERIENVKKTGLADQIIVEEYLGQKINDIIRYGVDTFVIGDDWRGKFDHLSRYCELVYLERTKGISSTKIREETFSSYSIGIITDYPDDNELVAEAKKVNGFSVQQIYADNPKNAETLKEKYDELTVCKSYEELVNTSDIVYVRTSQKYKTSYIAKALRAGRHVIYDPPAALNYQEQSELYRIAKENHVIILSNIKMVHIHVFNQLLWMTQGGLIGDILSIHCAISRKDKTIGNIFYNLLTTALCPVIKIMGKDYRTSDFQTLTDEDGIQFCSLDFKYDNARAVITVGDKVRVKNQLEIIGTEGTIRIGERWWRGSSFELNRLENDLPESYITNYQGNGFKYLIKAMAMMIESGRHESMGLFEDEALAIASIIEEIEAKVKEN